MSDLPVVSDLKSDTPFYKDLQSAPNNLPTQLSPNIQHATINSFKDADWIGECGLDKVCNVPWERQMAVFRWQLSLAEKLKKPVVVHCVRAYNDLIDLRKLFYSTPWVVHGFQGSLQLAHQLYRAGIAVSFGAALLDPHRVKLHEMFRQLDLPYLLETDDSSCGIEAVYQAAAVIKNSSISAIATSVSATYLSLISSSSNISLYESTPESPARAKSH